jgi:hypothetical protein
VSDGAATPHCAALVFLLLPLTSLLCTGALNGFGMITPEVSETADTSIAEGGDMAFIEVPVLESWLLRCKVVMVIILVFVLVQSH